MENLWAFFIDKVRKFLHIVLCFSPVGDKFRIRARQVRRWGAGGCSKGLVNAMGGIVSATIRIPSTPLCVYTHTSILPAC